MNHKVISAFIALGILVTSVAVVHADIPSAERRSTSVQVANPKAERDVYQPGENATVATRVKNKSMMPIEAILILEVIRSDGKTEKLTSQSYVIEGAKAENIKLNYAIPAKAPGGKYFARVFLKNPYNDKPFYSDDAVYVFDVNAAPPEGAVKQDDITKIKASSVDWPGAGSPPGMPAAKLPFTPRKKAFALVEKPEFNWPRHPDAVSYKVYISKTPFSSAKVILAMGVTDLKYVFDPEDASTPLFDGRTYTWTVLPKDAEGNTLVGNLDGFFATFVVQKNPVVKPKEGELDIKINDISTLAASTTGASEVYWNKENVPDGVITISGTVPNYIELGWNPKSDDDPSYMLVSDAPDAIIAEKELAGEKIKKVSISIDNGVTYEPLTIEKIDATTGKFAHYIKPTGDADYYIKFRVETTLARSKVIEPSGVKIIHYKHMTAQQEYTNLLDNLVTVLTNNDRRALMALIHSDWISTDTAFTDYSKFENSIIDIFNKVSSTFARWSTENVDVIVPGKRVTLSFTWTWKLYHTTYATSRSVNDTVRLDIRNIDGKWLIREDLDKKIFITDFGFTAPTAAPYTRLPPGHGTR